MIKYLLSIIAIAITSSMSTERACLRVEYVSVVDSTENAREYFNFIYSEGKIYDVKGNRVSKIKGYALHYNNKNNISVLYVPTEVILMANLKLLGGETSKANLTYENVYDSWCTGF